MAQGKGKNPYHSVSIVAGAARCPAALALKGKRFLSRDAPRLPLPECDQPLDCRCVYRHFDDRRAGPRRGDEKGRPARPAGEKEKRLSRGRRDADH